ncbi:GMC family oxidoreductase [Pseudomonas rhizosphaerae]|uniref:GMC family oxidoreductase n=1 Tax=Pseudomonas rhizosphaerae TaxID=216142 RepID=UPI002B497FFA|nr:GMC family oxidoreductase N-terminal domain-containing protein [Pseudomonas rhizosphaerae]MEB2872883.1 GMC family oxidoreductase N-terminal domain-containing protein [Pseudomonas rhizosphaerae]
MIDYLILGGGSAGCVLAARLSEDPNKRVCLVEAGRDIAPGKMPAAIASRYPGRAYLDQRNIWQRLTARMAAQGSRRYEQARLLGGGSAINALMTNRGAPDDYDEWGRLGAEGWSWDSCLPYFRKLETDCDFTGPLHGDAGPVRIRRTAPAFLSPFVKAVMGVLASRGLPTRPDQNGEWQDGVYVGAIGVSEQGERIPVSVCYLTDEVRARPNLTLRTECVVDRVLFRGTQAVGARLLDRAGAVEEVQAQEVIVCAGAIHSPALLIRSGVGPLDQLLDLGVPLVADRPGVGGNLMEHPSIAVSALLTTQGRTPHVDEHHEQAIVRFSSGLPGTVPGDMHGAILSRSGWHSVGYRLGTMFFWVNKSYSRGRVQVTSLDPLQEPDVRFSMLSEARDLQRLKQAVRMGAETLSAPGLDPLRTVVFPSSYSPRVAKVAMPGRFNALQRGVLSLLLDIAGPLRGWVVRGLVTQGVTLDKLLADDRALSEFVRTNVGGTWHPSGTCRMGRLDDPQAVTLGDGRVIGVTGLRVCDASLMPAIPCANTNVPTIMMAERIADLIKAG